MNQVLDRLGYFPHRAVRQWAFMLAWVAPTVACHLASDVAVENVGAVRDVYGHVLVHATVKNRGDVAWTDGNWCVRAEWTYTTHTPSTTAAAPIDAVEECVNKDLDPGETDTIDLRSNGALPPPSAAVTLRVIVTRGSISKDSDRSVPSP